MQIAIERARDRAVFAQFSDLVVEYEASLPADLRHVDHRDPGRLGLTDDAQNAAFLALVDGVPAGCVALATLDSATSLMKRLYVPPAHRGHGVARALVAVTVALARSRGHQRIVLDTDRDRLRAAYELYLALGFQVCEAYGPLGYADPTYMELLLRTHA